MMTGMQPETAAIHPLKFEKRFKLDANGNVAQEQVWVTWAKKGATIAQETSDKVSRVKKDPVIWRALKPHYDAWVEGQSIETVGTPLEVWPAMEKHIVGLLKSRRVFSVEDFANMSDGEVGKLGFPEARMKRDHAKEFLKNRDSIDETDALKKRIAELEAERKSVGEPPGDEPSPPQPVKRAPGRPRKDAG